VLRRAGRIGPRPAEKQILSRWLRPGVLPDNFCLDRRSEQGANAGWKAGESSLKGAMDGEAYSELALPVCRNSSELSHHRPGQFSCL